MTLFLSTINRKSENEESNHFLGKLPFSLLCRLYISINFVLTMKELYIFRVKNALETSCALFSIE